MSNKLRKDPHLNGAGFCLLAGTRLQIFKYLKGFVAARLPQREAAEDATQTIFFRALSSLATCRDNAAFPGWLFAIARNVVHDGHRRQRETVPPPENRDMRDDAPSPEEIARAALFMVSDECPFMNATCLTVDGGMSVLHHP